MSNIYTYFIAVISKGPRSLPRSSYQGFQALESSVRPVQMVFALIRHP